MLQLFLVIGMIAPDLLILLGECELLLRQVHLSVLKKVPHHQQQASAIANGRDNEAPFVRKIARANA